MIATHYTAVTLATHQPSAGQVTAWSKMGLVLWSHLYATMAVLYVAADLCQRSAKLPEVCQV